MTKHQPCDNVDLMTCVRGKKPPPVLSSTQLRQSAADAAAHGPAHQLLSIALGHHN